MQDENEIKQNTEEEIVDDITFVESTEDGDELPTKDIVKKLREEIKTLRKEKEEYLTGWQRSKADYANAQKDTDNKLKELRGFITAGLIEDLLPALDAFDMAISNKEVWEKVDSNWRNGMEYVYQQFHRTIESYGLSKIDAVNVPFDHNIHEAMENVDTEDTAKDHTVAQVIQSGYKMGDKVVRPARVKVYITK
ncbi:MAG: nucleotide exchange factor GrpE [Candidatus Pacebacteria bacterium]|nr:nucleotide exchange factor GrpE [Candidatus Paceibacterota bacterium]MBP9715579.1 nucleotide exchange factor GrpE [Candidatus Paceibacterota bacterium]